MTHPSFPLPASLYPLRTALLALLAVAACNRSSADTVALPDESPARRGDDAPVMVNPESPVEYPAALYARGIEGKVVLRLFVDETGQLRSDSTRVAESSGYPALDSAALAAVPGFRFAPALRNGTAVSATFLQPVHFRHPEAGGVTP